MWNRESLDGDGASRMMSGMKTNGHSLGIRVSGWASFVLLVLLVQEERGWVFWACVAACAVWLSLGLYILAAEMKSEAREMRERIRRIAAPSRK